MADFEQKNDLDLRFGGSTLGDFGYFYDVELPWIFKCLNSLRRNQVSPAGETVEPAPHQFKVEDDKLFIRDSDNQSWIMLMELSYKGGFVPEGVDFLRSTDKAADGATPEQKANKLAVYNAQGVLPANITGSAASMGGYFVDTGSLEDGQVLAFSVAMQKWYPADRMAGTGQGRYLNLRDHKGYLGVYNGGTTTEIEVPVCRLMPDVAYSYGEMAMTTQLDAGMALVCVSAGATPSVIPSFEEETP